MYVLRDFMPDQVGPGVINPDTVTSWGMVERFMQKSLFTIGVWKVVDGLYNMHSQRTLGLKPREYLTPNKMRNIAEARHWNRIDWGEESNFTEFLTYIRFNSVALREGLKAHIEKWFPPRRARYTTRSHARGRRENLHGHRTFGC